MDRWGADEWWLSGMVGAWVAGNPKPCRVKGCEEENSYIHQLIPPVLLCTEH